MTRLRQLTPDEIADAIADSAGEWAPELVFSRLCEAVAVAQVSVKYPGPSSKMVATLEIEPSKPEDDPDLKTRRKAATPAQISRMEETLQWMSCHVKCKKARAMLAQLARVRAIGGNYRAICKRRGWGKSQAYEICNVNLRAIAGALNRGKVPVRL